MDHTRKLWIALATWLVTSFAILLWAGSEIFRAAPPMPEPVLADDGRVLYTRADIERGRQVWQSMGGMQLGSIWGHGGYVAPDWSADWLHRKATRIFDAWATAEGVSSFRALPADRQDLLRARLEPLMRRNTFDPETRTITVPAARAEAMAAVAAHYVSLFGKAPETADLREAYAMKNDTVLDPVGLGRRAQVCLGRPVAGASGSLCRDGSSFDPLGPMPRR